MSKESTVTPRCHGAAGIRWLQPQFAVRHGSHIIALEWEAAECTCHSVSRFDTNDLRYHLYMRRNLSDWTFLHSLTCRNSEVELPCSDGGWSFVLRLEDHLGASPVLGPLYEPTLPGPVRGLSVAEVSPGTISISWEPPRPSLLQSSHELQLPEFPISDYEVLLENERQQQALTVVEQCSVLVTDVDFGHCYTIQVCATNALGRGPRSLAPQAIDLHRPETPAVPYDFSAPNSWDRNCAKRERERTATGCWGCSLPTLPFLDFASQQVTNIGLDFELCAFVCYNTDSALLASTLYSSYLLLAVLFTVVSEALEKILRPIVLIVLFQVLALAAIIASHLHIFAVHQDHTVIFSEVVEAQIMSWILCVRDLLPLWEVFGEPLPRDHLFQIIVRGVLGACAGGARHLLMHNAPNWQRRGVKRSSSASSSSSSATSSCSASRWDKSASSCSARFSIAIFGKGLAAGFGLLALLRAVGLTRDEASGYVGLHAGLLLIVAAFLELVRGPHSPRPKSPALRVRVSFPTLLRKCKTLSKLECYTKTRHILGDQKVVPSDLRDLLLKTRWGWTLRSRNLLDEHGPLLGLRGAGTLPALAAVLQRQVRGMEYEVFQLFQNLRASLETEFGVTSTASQDLSPSDAQLVVDLIAVACAIGESRTAALTNSAIEVNASAASAMLNAAGSVASGPPDSDETASGLGSVIAGSQRFRPAPGASNLPSTIGGGRGAHRIAAPLLHQALVRIHHFSPLAIPDPSLALTLILARAGQRAWSECLGCRQCCPRAELTQRLLPAQVVLDEEIDRRPLDGVPLTEAPAPWRGACARWSEVAKCSSRGISGLLDQALKQGCSCGRKHGRLLATLLEVADLQEPLQLVEAKDAVHLLPWVVDSRKIRHQRDTFRRLLLDQKVFPNLVGLLEELDDETYVSSSEVSFRRLFKEVLLTAEVPEERIPPLYALLGLLLGDSDSFLSAEAFDVSLAALVPFILSTTGKANSVTDQRSVWSSLREVVCSLFRFWFRRGGHLRLDHRSVQDFHAIATVVHASILETSKRNEEDEETPEVSPPSSSTDSANWAWEAMLRKLKEDGCDAVEDFKPKEDWGGTELEAWTALEEIILEPSDFCRPRLEATLLHLLQPANGTPEMAQAFIQRILAVSGWLQQEREWWDDSDSHCGPHSLASAIACVEAAAKNVSALDCGGALSLFPKQLASIAATSTLLRSGHDALEHGDLGLCLGAVLRVVESSQSPACSQYLLRAISGTLTASPAERTLWLPLVELLDRGEPRALLAAVAAAGGPTVRWAPCLQRSQKEADLSHEALALIMRIGCGGFLPPPLAVPPLLNVAGGNDGRRAMLARFLTRYGSGLIAQEDVMLLLEAGLDNRCSLQDFTLLCRRSGCNPEIGVTMPVALGLLEHLSEERCAELSHLHGEMERQTIQMHRKRRELQERVVEHAMNFWGVSDTLGLWLTHFFGVQAPGLRGDSMASHHLHGLHAPHSIAAAATGGGGAAARNSALGGGGGGGGGGPPNGAGNSGNPGGSQLGSAGPSAGVQAGKGTLAPAGSSQDLTDPRQQSMVRRRLWCCGLRASEAQKRKATSRGIQALQNRPVELSARWRAAAEQQKLLAMGAHPRDLRNGKESKWRSATKLRLFRGASRVAPSRLPTSPNASAPKLQSSSSRRFYGFVPARKRKLSFSSIVPSSVARGASSSDGEPGRLAGWKQWQQEERRFRDGFCHSRTLMSHDTMGKDEVKRLAAATRTGRRRWWRAAPSLFLDTYLWPILLHDAAIGVFEGALLVWLPTYLFSEVDTLGSLGAASAIFLVFFAAWLAQGLASAHSRAYLTQVQHCTLPVARNFLASAEVQWERLHLALALLSFLGLLAFGFAFQCASDFGGCVEGWLQVTCLTIGCGLLETGRPLSELSLHLKPRRGHPDGRCTVDLQNLAFALRTFATILVLPLLLEVGDGGREALSKGNWSGHSAISLALQPELQTLDTAGKALSALPASLAFLPLLAILPWSASGTGQQLHKHPVRRALHSAALLRTGAQGGPVISTPPVVAQVSPWYLLLRWKSPHRATSRSFHFDLQVSVDCGAWKTPPSSQLSWPHGRGVPRARIALAQLNSGEGVRYRVRCASVPADRAAALEDRDEFAAWEASACWGPWSEPSCIIHRPRHLEIVASLWPLLVLACIPLSLVDALLVALPKAWLLHMSRQQNGLVPEGIVLLIVIWPFILVHLLIWVLPRQLAQLTGRVRNVILSPLLRLVVVLLFPLCTLLSIIHIIVKWVRQGLQVETLPLIEEVGNIVDLMVLEVEQEEERSDAVDRQSTGGSSQNLQELRRHPLRLTLVSSGSEPSSMTSTLSANGEPEEFWVDCQSTVSIEETCLGRVCGAPLRFLNLVEDDGSANQGWGFGLGYRSSSCAVLVKVRPGCTTVKGLMDQVEDCLGTPVAILVAGSVLPSPDLQATTPVFILTSEACEGLEARLHKRGSLKVRALERRPQRVDLNLRIAWHLAEATRSESKLHGGLSEGFLTGRSWQQRESCLQVRTLVAEDPELDGHQEIPWKSVAWIRLGSGATLTCSMSLSDEATALEFRLLSAVRRGRQCISNCFYLPLATSDVQRRFVVAGLLQGGVQNERGQILDGVQVDVSADKKSLLRMSPTTSQESQAGLSVLSSNSPRSRRRPSTVGQSLASTSFPESIVTTPVAAAHAGNVSPRTSFVQDRSSGADREAEDESVVAGRSSSASRNSKSRRRGLAGCTTPPGPAVASTPSFSGSAAPAGPPSSLSLQHLSMMAPPPLQPHHQHRPTLLPPLPVYPSANRALPRYNDIDWLG